MIGSQLPPREYFKLCSETFESLDLESIETMGQHIHSAWLDGRFVFICGNGGSGANASHFCEDLGKSSLDPKDFNNDGAVDIADHVVLSNNWQCEEEECVPSSANALGYVCQPAGGAVRILSLKNQMYQIHF